jgi:hypothetical protein
VKDTKKEEKEQDESTQSTQSYSSPYLGDDSTDNSKETRYLHTSINLAINAYVRGRLRENPELSEQTILAGVERAITHWYTSGAAESLVHAVYTHCKGNQ